MLAAVLGISSMFVHSGVSVWTCCSLPLGADVLLATLGKKSIKRQQMHAGFLAVQNTLQQPHWPLQHD
eukprot:1316006-Amphidinium_carterae.1